MNSDEAKPDAPSPIGFSEPKEMKTKINRNLKDQCTKTKSVIWFLSHADLGLDQ